jgi:hypothetical protein
MKEIYIFTIIFTIVNVCIYYYVNSIETCIDNNKKTYIYLFYGGSLIYLLYLYFNFTNISNFENTPTTTTESYIVINITTPNPSKLIYWGNDFNVNGIVDVKDNKAIIPVSNTISIKYRIIDINEKLSDVMSN